MDEKLTQALDLLSEWAVENDQFIFMVREFADMSARFHNSGQMRRCDLVGAALTRMAHLNYDNQPQQS